MKPDQLARLQLLQEKLADRFLVEADPDAWPGAAKIAAGGKLADLSQQERGDSYWCKKNAMATGGVLRFVTDILTKPAPAPAGEGARGDTEAESDLDRQVREAERRSAKLVEEAVARAKGKPEFDRRTHGG